MFHSFDFSDERKKGKEEERKRGKEEKKEKKESWES